MDAGLRAQEQAVKAAQRVEATRRKLATAERHEHAWRTGAEGERRTAAVLEQLQEHGWVLIHDVIRPGKDRANIDHLAVGPGGVVIIDSKAWNGTVQVQAGVLVYKNRRYPKALDKVSQQAGEVSALLAPHHRRLCTALVCLVGQPTPGEQSAVVPVIGLDELIDHIRARPLYLRADEVHTIAAHLQHQLTAPRTGAPHRPKTTPAPAPTPVRAQPSRPLPVPVEVPVQVQPVSPPPVSPFVRHQVPARPITPQPSLQARATWYIEEQFQRLVEFVRRVLAVAKRVVIGVAVLWLAWSVLPLLIAAMSGPAEQPTPAKPPATHQPAGR